MNNILITSAGRRVSLLQAFEKEMLSKKINGKIIAADAEPKWSSACHIAKSSFRLKRVIELDYIEDLLQKALSNDVKVIVPTIDTELLLLSENRLQFYENGIHIVVSDPGLVRLCRDKRNTHSLFETFGFKSPKIYSKESPDFPVYAKPYDGSLSKDNYVLSSKSDITPDISQNEKLIFMEYLEPTKYQEYTVDVYYNNKGRLKCAVPRKRVEVRGGEISKGRTERNALYNELINKMEVIEGARGCLTMQFFLSRSSNEIRAIEINPRFGGGFPLSYAAGANYPGYIIEEYLLGKEISFNESWTDNLVMIRYDQEVFFVDDISK